MNKITLRLETLEALAVAAREGYERCSKDDYIPTVEILVERKAEDHNGATDKISACFLSKWAECNPRKYFSGNECRMETLLKFAKIFYDYRKGF